jgi:NAD dependent epimerase/dehydratase family enzyme
MQDFTDTLAQVMRRPSVFHVPSALVSTAMGDAADEFLLASARVLPERLEADGYDFLYPTLEGALRHQLGRTMAPLVPQEDASV